ncbi:hypothetical protein Pat9b_3346 [Pantoea sp. At-9b]|jgi:hypothetical protein|nr:hypothetical protein Pat9b_3346 [Pantoea sp. At-9b]
MCSGPQNSHKSMILLTKAKLMINLFNISGATAVACDFLRNCYKNSALICVCRSSLLRALLAGS